MKRTLLVVVIAIVAVTTMTAQRTRRNYTRHAQGEFKPIIGVDLYASRLQSIRDAHNNEHVRYRDSEGEIRWLQYTHNYTFDYDVTIGAKYEYAGINVYSKNVVSCVSNDLLNNKPYNIEFILGAYYQTGDVRIGVEHMCKHPVFTDYTGINYNVRGSHDKFYFHYNF